LLRPLSAIDQIHYLHDRIFTEMLRGQDHPQINAAQARLLTTLLWQHDGINIQELADATCLKKTTVSTMLPRLIELELVTVSPDIKDQRARIVRLTPKAQSLKDIHQDICRKLESVLLQDIGEHDLEIFLSVLSKIKERLLEHEPHK
jgi:DNA-binding MarR family transcriptional regulator